MKKATTIFLYSVLLTMVLFCTPGVSVGRCSCTGEVSLYTADEGDCCPDESDCMTIQTLQLSDYMPTTAAAPDLPVFPTMFAVFPFNPSFKVFPIIVPENTCRAEAPPGALAHTVTVLRV